MAPSQAQSGRRARWAARCTLFGAKIGGRHRQERALVLTSLRRTKRRCLSYGFTGELTIY